MYEPSSRRSASVTWHVLIKYLSDMWSTPQEDKACTHEMQKNKLGCFVPKNLGRKLERRHSI